MYIKICPHARRVKITTWQPKSVFNLSRWCQCAWKLCGSFEIAIRNPPFSHVRFAHARLSSSSSTGWKQTANSYCTYTFMLATGACNRWWQLSSTHLPLCRRSLVPRGTKSCLSLPCAFFFFFHSIADKFSSPPRGNHVLWKKHIVDRKWSALYRYSQGRVTLTSSSNSCSLLTDAAGLLLLTLWYAKLLHGYSAQGMQMLRMMVIVVVMKGTVGNVKMTVCLLAEQNRNRSLLLRIQWWRWQWRKKKWISVYLLNKIEMEVKCLKFQL